MDFQICTGSKENVGVTRQNGIVSFSRRAARESSCYLLLYPKDGSPVVKIPMKAQGSCGTIYTVGICGLDWENYDYNFEVNGEETTDVYARRISGREVWAEESRRVAALPPKGFIPQKEQAESGKEPRAKGGAGEKRNRQSLGQDKEKMDGAKIKSSFYFSDFKWKDEGFQRIKKEDMVLYKLHVRGFSMGMKGEGGGRGTVEAIERRLNYLKGLGVTTLLFMPLYEFEEILCQDAGKQQENPKDLINCWGYAAGNYFAPKASFLGEGNHPDHLKRLIQKMHQKQMECILEFYFPEKINPHLILEILHYWHREYHVDGFRLIGGYEIACLAAVDPALSGCKLFYEGFPEDLAKDPKRIGPELFTYNDTFLYELRKVLNHRGGSIYEFACQMRRQQECQGFVNYVTENNGFTLWDLFSYEHKHNEQNLEGNQDGNNWNFSINCGQEGISKSRQVKEGRKRQIKNAFTALFFGQGIPMVWMGDECANSQRGNNNAYCQDNSIGWKDWNTTVAAKQIQSFLQGLARIRKEHPALRSPQPYQMQDYEGHGFPDLSYHSDSGWWVDFAMNRSFVGMFYCGAYAGEETSLYVAYNFQSIPQKFALPKGMEWELLLDTAQEPSILETPKCLKDIREFEAAEQSVCLLRGKPFKEKKPKRRGKGVSRR